MPTPPFTPSILGNTFFFFNWSGEWAERAYKPCPSHYIVSRQAPGIAGPVPRSLYLPPLPGIHLHSLLSLWWTTPRPNFFTHGPLPTSRELIPAKKPSPSSPTPTPHLLPPLVLVNFGKRLGTGKLVGLLQVIQSEGESCHSGNQVRRSGRRRSALIGSGCVRLYTLRPSTSC